MSVIKILAIYGIYAITIFLFGCSAANENTPPSSTPERRTTAEPSPSPLVDDRLLAIARFREQPLVLERINTIFHTNEADAKVKAARIFAVTDAETSRLVACDDGLSWRVIDPTDLKEVRFTKGKAHGEPTVLTISPVTI